MIWLQIERVYEVKMSKASSSSKKTGANLTHPHFLTIIINTKHQPFHPSCSYALLIASFFSIAPNNNEFEHQQKKITSAWAVCMYCLGGASVQTFINCFWLWFMFNAPSTHSFSLSREWNYHSICTSCDDASVEIFQSISLWFSPAHDGFEYFIMPKESGSVVNREWYLLRENEAI